jgi:hypothetical protein
LTVSSFRKQDITLIARFGIEAINAPAGVVATPLRPDTANCDLHLPEGKPVTIHLKLGSHKPNEWADRVLSA